MSSPRSGPRPRKSRSPSTHDGSSITACSPSPTSASRRRARATRAVAGERRRGNHALEVGVAPRPAVGRRDVERVAREVALAAAAVAARVARETGCSRLRDCRTSPWCTTASGRRTCRRPGSASCGSSRAGSKSDAAQPASRARTGSHFMAGPPCTRDASPMVGPVAELAKAATRAARSVDHTDRRHMQRVTAAAVRRCAPARPLMSRGMRLDRGRPRG